jgi:large subunit ribosomal protein L21
MKYAIVENGGKQYRAVEGSIIEVDLMDAEIGQDVALGSVLLLVDGDDVSVGAPLVSKAQVKTTVEGHFKGPKIVIFHYRAKKRIRKKGGHRQQYTRLKVNSIEVE